MNKIEIKINLDNIIFDISDELDDSNLNYTNVINTEKLKFAEDYIVKNIKSVAGFITRVLDNTNVNNAIIKNIDIAETILILIKNLKTIKKINFTENKKLSYTLSNLLLENKNIDYINCYTMPEYVFKKFKNVKIDLRYDYFFVSDFMERNDLDTYSKIYYKKVIKIDKPLEHYDLLDLDEFFKMNSSLKKIELINYTKDNLDNIISLLDKYKKDKILIMVYQTEENTNMLFNNINEFKKLEKKYNIDIKIKYSSEYKRKNIIKQINLNLFKFIIIFIIIMCLSVIVIYNIVGKNDNKKIKKISSSIKEVIEDEDVNKQQLEENNLEPVKPSAYFTNYSEAFNELLKINKDTVGWIKIKNTKVNYPVVQASNNDYYLNHDYNLETNLAGWIYVDYRNNIESLSKNTIIYGHNVAQDELMFGSLDRMLEQSWYSNKDNRIITFNTIYGNHSFRIFSIYTIKETNDYLITDFKSDQSFINYVQKAKDLSIYNFNVDVKSNDKLLTLSTCYGSSSEYRIVVHAKEI